MSPTDLETLREELVETQNAYDWAIRGESYQAAFAGKRLILQIRAAIQRAEHAAQIEQANRASRSDGAQFLSRLRAAVANMPDSHLKPCVKV